MALLEQDQVLVLIVVEHKVYLAVFLQKLNLMLKIGTPTLTMIIQQIIVLLLMWQVIIMYLLAYLGLLQVVYHCLLFTKMDQYGNMAHYKVRQVQVV